MPLHALDAEPRQVVAPAADDAGDEPAAHEPGDALVGHVEVGGVDAGELRLPGPAGLVVAARVEGRHVRIEPGDDLHGAVALRDAVGRQRLEPARPVHAPAEAHPPGVREVEERRAVAVLQVATVGADPERPVRQQRVVSLVGRHLQRGLAAVQVGVVRVRADGPAGIGARRAGRVAHAPLAAARPVGRHALLRAVRPGHDHVQQHVRERVGVALARGVGPFRCNVLHGAAPLAHRPHALPSRTRRSCSSPA